MAESNRVALITGASRGLGAVIARVLAERGCDLVLGARDAEPLNRMAATLRAPGRKIVAIDGDVADQSTRTHLVNAARSLGGLHLLVNNASALGDIGPLSTADEDRFVRVLHINVLAPLALVQLAQPLLAGHRGLVVNVSSDAAHGAYPGWGQYGASEAALELVTRTLGVELRDTGVAVVIVDPGDMRTRMHQEAFPGQDISDRPLPDVTVPFWTWLFDQQPADVTGERFAAQQEDRRWLQPA